MALPAYQNLPINLLAACFNKNSATYKFYWFLSIINRVEVGDLLISKKIFLLIWSHNPVLP